MLWWYNTRDSFKAVPFARFFETLVTPIPRSCLSSSLRGYMYRYQGRRTRRPSLDSVVARLNALSHSSTALPAPNPTPNQTGHARRLNRSTENMTPKDKPRPERIMREERQRSHLSLSNASLIGLVVLATAPGAVALSAIFGDLYAMLW